jgi:UDP-N-acetylmuramate--alanine ligase
MAFLDGFSKIHVIGAGGIGVSAVARLLAHRGKAVTGSDGKESEITHGLADVGVKVLIGADAAHVPADADLILYSTAVPATHPERVAAAASGIRQLSYPEFLGELTKEYKTICVSGTNGKSTTTAMLGLMLERAGLDPTVIVGSKVTSFPDGNLRVGKSEWLVLEACEYQAHILHYSPWAIVITNIEEDHLDYFRDLAHIRDTFQEYVRKLPKDGLLVMNADDKVSAGELKPKVAPIWFSMRAAADYSAQDITVADGFQKFKVTRRGGTSAGAWRVQCDERAGRDEYGAGVGSAAERGARNAA